MTETFSLLAKDHGLYLGSASDALSVIASGLSGCIFTQSDVAADFFDLSNGIAGETFQKFVNYNVRVAFILTADHGFGDRVTELVRDHRRHSSVRFFGTIEEAIARPFNKPKQPTAVSVGQTTAATHSGGCLGR